MKYCDITRCCCEKDRSESARISAYRLTSLYDMGIIWVEYYYKCEIQGGVAVNIRPSAAIRQNYNEIAEMCRKTAEPVFLTKNGEGDLVVMDIETFNRREKMLKLREELLAVEEDRLRGSKGYSVDEVASMMRGAIREASGHGKTE